MDIQKLKDLFKELNELIKHNFSLIHRAFPNDINIIYRYFDIDYDLDVIEIVSYDGYEDFNSLYLPISIFESEEKLQNHMYDIIKMNEEKKRKAEEEEEKRKQKLAETKKSKEYKKYLELKEKFENI